MDFSSLIFAILLFTSIQPVIRQRILEARRSRVMRRREQRRGSRVIARAPPGDDGLPRHPRVPLHRRGRLRVAMRAIDLTAGAPPGQGQVFVPHYATSGGTLTALAADEIV